MEITYTPKVCTSYKDDEGNDVQPTFSGAIKMRVPNFDERYEFIENSGIDVGDDGGIKRGESNFSIIRKLVKNSQKFYVGVQLTRISDGKEFSTFEGLAEDSDCDGILIEVAGQVRGGFKPSPK